MRYARVTHRGALRLSYTLRAPLRAPLWITLNPIKLEITERLLHYRPKSLPTPGLQTPVIGLIVAHEGPNQTDWQRCSQKAYSQPYYQLENCFS